MIIAVTILLAISLFLLYLFDKERRCATKTFDIVISALSETCFATAAIILTHTLILTLTK